MTPGMYPNFYDPRMMNPMARFAFPRMANATPFMGNQGLPMQAQAAPQFPMARAPLAQPTAGTPETQAFNPVARSPLAVAPQSQMRRPFAPPDELRQAPPTGGINSLRGYAFR